jgi:prepilin-type N-terminal cleavage/methylation domain-containing protein
MNRPTTVQSAFTLVELLVVIVIITLLASLLAPAGRSALERAKLAGCMGNLRQLGGATGLYAADHKGWTPDWTPPPGGTEPYFHGGSAPVHSMGNYRNPYRLTGIGKLVDGYTDGAATVAYCPGSRYTSFTGQNRERWQAREWQVVSSYNIRLNQVDPATLTPWTQPGQSGFGYFVGIRLSTWGRVVHIADLVGGAAYGDEARVLAHGDAPGRWNTLWTDGSVTTASGDQTDPEDPSRTVLGSIGWIGGPTGNSWGTGALVSGFRALENQ